MSRRQEPCRNFLRGSCKYGANCRFLHVSPNQNQNQYQNQQRPSTNPFGFGSSQTFQQQPQQQQQRQQQNPFGFGANQTSASQFQAPSKPFENKWVRSASTAPSSTAPRQTDPQQAQPSVHTCTDPVACKNIIADDFKNEAPLWKLTCYAHFKGLPCDIHGDISYEELRALAYEEAKKGHNIQSIVGRERNLLQSKLSEFENLLRNPYVPPNSNLGPSFQTNAAPSITSFSQLGAANNVASAFRPPIISSTSNNPFGQPSFPQNNMQMPPQPEIKFGTSFGSFGNQMTNQGHVPAPNFSFGKALNTNANGNATAPNFSFGTSANGNLTGGQHFAPSFPHSSMSTGNSNASNKQQNQLLSLGLGFASASPPPEEKHEECKDDGIWLQERWSIGKIPEEAPPLMYCK